MPSPGFVLNLAPQHNFAALADWPEAQLLLLVPQAIWAQAQKYVPRVEDARLAGRFGANPGEFEWEVLERPPGLKWLPRTLQGDAAFFGFAVTSDPAADPVEVYGLIDIGSDCAWWYDAVFDMSPLLSQSESVARATGREQAMIQLEMSLAEYRAAGLLTAEPTRTEPAWRVGSRAEVKRFKDALVALLERARHADQSEAKPK
jgi:hypothetical protein